MIQAMRSRKPEQRAKRFVADVFLSDSKSTTRCGCVVAIRFHEFASPELELFVILVIQ